MNLKPLLSATLALSALALSIPAHALNARYVGIDQPGMEFQFTDSGEFLVTGNGSILQGGTYTQIDGYNYQLQPESGSAYTITLSEENPCLMNAGQSGRFEQSDCTTAQPSGNDQSGGSADGAIAGFDTATATLRIPLLAITDGYSYSAVEEVSFALVSAEPLIFQLTGFDQSVGLRALSNADTVSAVYYETYQGVGLWFPVVNILANGTPLTSIQDVTLQYYPSAAGMLFSLPDESSSSSSSCTGMAFEDCMSSLGYSSPEYTDGSTVNPVVYE